MNRGSWHLRAGSVVFAWLLAVVAVALAHRFVPLAGWLLVHLLGLGAASNAILIWSRHFTDALLRRKAGPPFPGQVIGLAVFNIGAVAVITGMVVDRWSVEVLLSGHCVPTQDRKWVLVGPLGRPPRGE